MAGLQSGLVEEAPILKLKKVKSDSEALKVLYQTVRKVVFNLDSNEADRIKSMSFGEFDYNSVDLDNEALVTSRRRKLSKTRINKKIIVNKNYYRGGLNHPVLNNLATIHRASNMLIHFNYTPISFALLIDSEFLNQALDTQEHRKLLVMLLFSAKTVLFYSLSPDQKILVVKLLKQNFSFHPVVACIGKGHSNLGILSESDISITIGLENDDYRWFSELHLSNFSKLTHLLFIHGHKSYYRFSKIIRLTIFKEYMIAALVFLFQIQAEFSGTPLISYDFSAIYELLLCLIPVVIIGTFDQCLTDAEALENPKVYSEGFSSFKKNGHSLLFLLMNGSIYGIIAYLFVTFGITFIINDKGFTEDFQVKGFVSFILACLLFYAKVYRIDIHGWLRINLVIVLSGLLFLVFIIICNDYS